MKAHYLESTSLPVVDPLHWVIVFFFAVDTNRYSDCKFFSEFFFDKKYVKYVVHKTAITLENRTLYCFFYI